MKKLLTLLSFTLPLAPTVSTIYTGFNYGAFWGIDSNVKKTVDFQAGFSYAQNLTSKVRFNSARLFTCKTQGTVDEPTEAFDAAIQTKTNLFLGFWITPASKGDPLEDIIKNELSALEKGFQKHGQALADLVIGLSVGSEDIYRSEDTKDVGVEATEVSATIKKVKDTIASSSFAAYMKDKPVGHVDTAKHAVVDGADFFGMTAYPYWNKDPIAKGQESFEATLNDLKQRAGDTLIWIAEMGWPYEGVSQGNAVASAENMQRYWNDVGCKVVDEYTTFWFELIKDSEANQPDWGVIDPVTHKPRINFSCAREQPNALNAPANSSSISPSVMSSSVLVPTTLATLPSQSVYLESSVAADQPSIPISPSALSVRRTTHVTTTIVVTVQPSDAFSLPEVDDSTSTTIVTATVYTTKSSEPSFNLASVEISANLSAIAPATSAPSFAASILPIEGPWCVTMADIAWNGQYKPVDGGPAGPDGKCSPPPTYTGLPYGLGQPITPASSHPNASSLSLVPSGFASPVLSNPVSCSGSVCHPYCIGKPGSPVASATPASLSAAAPVLVPSSSIVPGLPSSANPVPSGSTAPVPLSYIVPAIPSPAAQSPPSSSVVQPSGPATHAYCVRKSSLLAGTAAPSASAKPAPLDVALPEFSFPSGRPAKKEVVKRERKNWVGWLW